MSVWSRLTGAIAGIGVGGAAAAAMEPILEVPKQEAWRGEPNRVLDIGTLAHLIATGLLDEEKAIDEAKRNGYNENRLRARIQLALTVPGIGELDRMLNRGIITRAQFEHALSKHGIEAQFHAAYYNLLSDRLSTATVANAVQQGHLPNVGSSGEPILPAPIASKGTPQPPSAQGQGYDIPLTTIPLDPEAEAAAQGYDLERLRVEANLAGLPPPQELLLDLWRRGIITEDAVVAGIREGHTKTKWIPAILALKRRRLPAQEYANAWLREWVTREQAEEGARAQGITADDLELLYLNRGRPAAPGQMWTAWARGVEGPRGVPTDYQDHEEAIRRSNIRPEYAPMLWGIRFYFPPLFQLNRLVQAGAVDIDTAAKWAHYNRTAPEVIDALKAYWRKGTTAADRELTATELADEYFGHYIDAATFRKRLAELGYSDEAVAMKVELVDARRVKRARQQRESRIHSQYVGHRITRDDAVSALQIAGVPTEARDLVLTEWDAERDINVATLTPAQVVKAFKKGVQTRDWALAELLERGYADADATTLLDEA